ncbi:hypothetical protein GLOIN_2v1476493 [Rhizophagus irregularis DAOM 181602=DAOM 197198]|uniref:Uncharacterized protein n=1 Tax=Rhizophagus irregularis (strain DAOM 181602 / DAOM 197198 / MUCL 43194) TaxID=747089 RepID=A0A2P4Q8Q5_RHIID|nr:hypothetical protein GLOIN_2v1476493 [Rhizophagus irregularis DAOM 181602=DAOM 197198]POG74007.1 hypothetical protein GLOIN_2v1476493 [Rhizophagus irregularis DAOM 181602=DAOM 197198]|eukprot:XP_025180873.1 hypothetical protein GLOIN_2v1476493 [Rhizophagus irregularis DAOM 181602=DAOM 197198]
MPIWYPVLLALDATWFRYPFCIGKLSFLDHETISLFDFWVSFFRFIQFIRHAIQSGVSVIELSWIRNVFQLDPLGLWVFGFLDLLGSMQFITKTTAYYVNNEESDGDFGSQFSQLNDLEVSNSIQLRGNRLQLKNRKYQILKSASRIQISFEK